jgi:hypothetical protein
VTSGQAPFFSSDAGAFFDDIMPQPPTDIGFCALTFVLDSKKLLVGCPSSWSGNPAAVIRSSDGA